MQTYNIIVNRLQLQLIEDSLITEYNNYEKNYSKIKTDFNKKHNQNIRIELNNIFKLIKEVRLCKY